jgi:8-oxo-dGTP diphosphatase
MKIIKKVGAMVIENNQFLMVRKVGKDVWTSLGGRIEKGETEREALKREVMEEIGCGCKIVRKLGNFRAKAVFDDAILNLVLYLIELKGEPKITDSEIEEFGYICKDYPKHGIKLTETITDHVIPYCIEEDLLNWN